MTATAHTYPKRQVRHDTAANWTAQNPTLLAGEYGMESDTLKSKVGDGSTAWTSLAYMKAGTATTLETARTIAGTSFNGSANIFPAGIYLGRTIKTSGTSFTTTANTHTAIVTCIAGGGGGGGVAGSFKITVRNNSAGSLSDAIVIRFAVVKAVTA